MKSWYLVEINSGLVLAQIDSSCERRVALAT